ncbi:MAG TPA: glycoside hydrolase family 15 protein [Methanoculleus sp.]|jgi:GH15 family glucan-1,4-alpha-glucosidase|uniref:glycoside hydrolase family 15 protein n=1 Tax=Methanoculleus sp. TaxID=90427 RepID=UPI000AF2ED0D|nr:glycoside hydrolase family 15 protein [Methanoculleus sp.]HNT08962.1 glycoside hydrolase family 15 protein [Methanoculleus sp.]HNV38789.1 glycoside hydrolase family 15 protein [Methanoculleus sp.]HOC84635.1 glycoside hydrolase family 15 protein [Methanoculleus sp.]HOF96099.1 glycoside hydrolase family 15 protein [Methanoculleus sp.]HOS68228.1 glycoside hydrolase family 15 protein [Methanoculleus sp.]
MSNQIQQNRPQAHGEYRPIEDYGVIGNGHTVALISSSGSIDWLCFHRFDSPSLFARILDPGRGGYWSVTTKGAFESSHRYQEETNILETTLRCAGGTVVLRDFMDIASIARLRRLPAPGRIVRIAECTDGKVGVVSRCQPRPNYARTHPEFALYGDQVTFGGYTLTGPTAWQVDDADASLTCRITLRAGETTAFTLATEDDATLPQRTPADALKVTTDYWRKWSSACTYRGPYRDIVIRNALTLKMMTYEPSGAIVAAPTTSLPETFGGERNWDYRFTWIRDASLTLYALLLAGYLDNEQPFFDWLVRTVKLKGTGISILYPIIPEGRIAETVLDNFRGYRDSRPVRIGNQAAVQEQLDVYGEVMGAIQFAWRIGKYDPTPLWGTMRQMLDWVTRHWHDRDSGLWEVRGGVRHFVYSKAMMWFALDCGIEIAEGMRLSGDIKTWRRERDLIHEEVLDKGWSDDLGAFKQSYEDENLDAANLRLPLINFVGGDDPRMLSTIDATLEHLVVDGLCYRYIDAPEGVTGKEGSFVVCTTWLINALIRAGRTGEAHRMFQNLLARASPLGLYAEEIQPATGAHMGNFPQSFSQIGIINAAVSLAHAGQVGTVSPHHAAAADAAGHGGGGKRTG